MSIRRSVFPCIWLLVFLVACRKEVVPATPTPFGFNQTAVPVVSMGQPTAVSLADLLAAPDTFSGQYLQLSGAYKQLPLLVCSQDPHPGPATWAITAVADPPAETTDELLTPTPSPPLLVAIGGFDAQLRQLISQGTTVTVNGYWVEWNGVVGCGKQAIPRQMWYLRATELVLPNQLARLTAVPNQPTEPEPPSETTPQPETPITSTVTSESTPVTITATTEAGTAVATTIVLPTLEPTSEEAYPAPGQPTATPSATADGSGTPTPDDEPTTPIAVTATPTFGDGSDNGTSTAVAATPGVSATPGNYTVIDVDPINPDASMYGVETLAAWQKHNWQLTLTSSKLITISVAAEPSMDLTIAVFDSQQNLLVEQNSSPAGHLETIRNLSVDPTKAYIVQVYESRGVAGDYFITLVGDDPDIVLSSRGILSYGQTGQDQMAEGHYHFWYFYGEQGDVVDIATVAANSSLLLLTLYNHEGDVMVDGTGRNLEYVEKEIRSFTVPETGLYLIWLEEAIFDPATYSITVTKR